MAEGLEGADDDDGPGLHFAAPDRKEITARAASGRHEIGHALHIALRVGADAQDQEHGRYNKNPIKGLHANFRAEPGERGRGQGYIAGFAQQAIRSLYGPRGCRLRSLLLSMAGQDPERSVLQGK